jgi:hypothetical protein
MRIKYLSGPKSGQFDHVPNSQEFQVLASAGLIEIFPYKDFRERLKDEMAAIPKPAQTASWGIHRVVIASREANPRSVLVVKTAANGDQTFYDAPPADCPPAIAERFRKEAAVEAQMHQDREHAKKVAAEKNNFSIPGRR